MTFDFTPGNRNDCNVADFDAQADTLTDATGGSYEIGTGGVGGPGEGETSTPTPTPRPTFQPTCTPTPQPSPGLPATARISPTLVMIGLGTFFLILGTLLLPIF